MKLFMIEVPLPETPTQEFFSLIPAQRIKITELLMKRKILNYSVSADRLKLWIVLPAENENEARTILAEQPMDKYFEYHFHELMLHEMTGAIFSTVSLN